MIVITGATGTIGSEIVRQLAARAVRVRAVTRNPERVRVPAGVEVIRGDYRDLGSMAAAMTGADAAFLVGVLGPDDAETDRALVRTARDAGVRRIVKLSAIGTGEPELGRVGTWHMPGEQAARESGLEWTILRPSSFASNTLSWADAIRLSQPVPNLTGTGSQGVIDPRDVAAVAVEALVTAGHSGHTYTLTGPTLLTCADQVATLATVLGQPLDVVDVPEDVAREHMISSGMSPEFADGALAAKPTSAPEATPRSPTMSGRSSAAHPAATQNGPPIMPPRSPPTQTTAFPDHHDECPIFL
ncbi:NAD(P)H-binding protein [Nocardia sp. NPDC052112]|uniref:NAD(P)H-binding protein n=1 Tax=Nocardia sp. NPDC052112 TaxID=3155646 RepID=UPI00343AD0AA